MDCSACDFDIVNITAYDGYSNKLLDGNPDGKTLEVSDLVHGGDYLFVIEGPPGISEGNFDCTIECESDSPTTSPTDEPTTTPTDEPTVDPTVSPTKVPSDSPSLSPTTDPTASPSVDPTVSPTKSPTVEPTLDPSASPTTPAPSHPGEKACGDTFNGTYHGETMNVEVQMSYDGDLEMDCAASDFEIGSITALDSNGLALTDVHAAPSYLEIHDLLHATDVYIAIDGAGDGVTSGTLDCDIICTSDSPTKSPTTDPTVEPTTDPTVEPTVDPTNGPTVEPTLSPSKEPTTTPTSSPTLEPTLSPSKSPTTDPTVSPTDDPTASPTTPAPTHPGELCCGDTASGSYSGDAVFIEVRMPFDGDMTMDCSGSDFEIGSITAYDSNSNELTDVDETTSILTVHDLSHDGDYDFSVEGAYGVTSGYFVCAISCSSDAPTKTPTVDPTPAPTKEPTESPSKSPTLEPTVQPSNPPTVEPTLNPSTTPTVSPTPWPTPNPTDEPSVSPTPQPTDNPTTPAPTHPGEKICGDSFNGTYHGEPMNVEVRMPYDGDMTMDCSACSFDIVNITAYDGYSKLLDGNPDAKTLEVYDLIHGTDYMFVIDGPPDVTEGDFDCTIICESDAPTMSPTDEPTTSPTDEPTVSPTKQPTVEPTLSPTKEPTESPSKSPTVEPTVDPTSSPTTPAPTHPGELQCGDSFNGSFHGEPFEVEIRTPFDVSVFQLGCTASTFLITNITGKDSNGNILEDQFTLDDGAIFEAHDLPHGGDYWFSIDGNGTSGIFKCNTLCRSDAPTTSPSTDPTVEPTIDPSTSPTLEPTPGPTTQPTESPSKSPTLEPTTASPTPNPTTPSPTHPGEKTCEDEFTGSYHGEPVQFEVRLPYDGDIIVDCTDSDFEIQTITAWNSDGFQLTDNDDTEVVVVLDQLHDSDTTFIITGASYVTSGTFDCVIECASDMPSAAPTKSPTPWPTMSPSEDPTASPTEDPTTDSPTSSPTADPTIPPGCCAGDSERATTRCNAYDDEKACIRRASCHWIQTFDDTDCEWEDEEPPTDPGCCLPLDGYVTENCMNFYTEYDCPTDSCYWTPTSDSYDCSKLWETPGCCKSSGTSRKNARCEMMTSEDTCESRSACEWMETNDPSECSDDDSGDDYEAGCCAGDSERASTRCNKKDTQTACDRLSSCHWIVTDDAADCDWYGAMDAMETESGCCYATSVQSLAFRADLCQQYWNNDDCMASYDAEGTNNCRWRATDDDVDCAGLTTFMAAVNVGPPGYRYETKTLFGADSVIMNKVAASLNEEVSLMTVLLFFGAIYVLYRLYSCWKSVRTDEGYQKLGDGSWNGYVNSHGPAGYQSMA